jgi:hypothetical protein
MRSDDSVWQGCFGYCQNLSLCCSSQRNSGLEIARIFVVCVLGYKNLDAVPQVIALGGKGESLVSIQRCPATVIRSRTIGYSRIAPAIDQSEHPLSSM